MIQSNIYRNEKDNMNHSRKKKQTDRNPGTGPNAEEATFFLDNLSAFGSRILDFLEVSTVLNLQDL